MKLGSTYFDTRSPHRYGTFCGYTGAGHGLAILKRNGHVRYCGVKYLKQRRGFAVRVTG